MLGKGVDVVTARKYAFHLFNQGTSSNSWVANSTSPSLWRFGCPPGGPKIRIVGIYFAATAIPADADGTMLINALVNDVSEGADDTIIASFDAEAVILAADKFYKATLATETSEEENTLESGDTLRFTFVNNSAAINTNASITAIIEFVLVPRAQSEETLPFYDLPYPSGMSKAIA